MYLSCPYIKLIFKHVQVYKQFYLAQQITPHALVRLSSIMENLIQIINQFKVNTTQISTLESNPTHERQEKKGDFYFHRSANYKSFFMNIFRDKEPIFAHFSKITCQINRGFLSTRLFACL